MDSSVGRSPLDGSSGGSPSIWGDRFEADSLQLADGSTYTLRKITAGGQWQLIRTKGPDVPNASVVGRVWEDLNGNGSYDVGEGIRSAVVWIDTDSSGNLGGADAQALTDEYGQYSLGGLSAGSYTRPDQLGRGIYTVGACGLAAVGDTGCRPAGNR